MNHPEVSFSQLVEKDAQKFCTSKKNRTFASRILSKCTKSLILSTLLRQVSVVTTHAGSELCFLVIN